MTPATIERPSAPHAASGSRTVPNAAATRVNWIVATAKSAALEQGEAAEARGIGEQPPDPMLRREEAGDRPRPSAATQPSDRVGDEPGDRSQSEPIGDARDDDERDHQRHDQRDRQGLADGEPGDDRTARRGSRSPRTRSIRMTAPAGRVVDRVVRTQEIQPREFPGRSGREVVDRVREGGHRDSAVTGTGCPDADRRPADRTAHRTGGSRQSARAARSGAGRAVARDVPDSSRPERQMTRPRSADRDGPPDEGVPESGTMSGYSTDRRARTDRSAAADPGAVRGFDPTPPPASSTCIANWPERRSRSPPLSAGAVVRAHPHRPLLRHPDDRARTTPADGPSGSWRWSRSRSSAPDQRAGRPRRDRAVQRRDLDLRRDVGSRRSVAGALVVSIGVRWLVVPPARSRPSLPVVLAVRAARRDGVSAWSAPRRAGARTSPGWLAGTWLTGIATMLLVFIARSGSRVAAICGRSWRHSPRRRSPGSSASSISRGTPPSATACSGWTWSASSTPTRLTGVIRSPTSTAALVMLPISFYLAAVILARDQPSAAGGGRPLRAAPGGRLPHLQPGGVHRALRPGGHRRLADPATARDRPARGRDGRRARCCCPAYLSIRGQAVGASGQLDARPDPDRQRSAAPERPGPRRGRMFLDQPLVGQGYRAYRQLSVQFGDPILNAPHNEWLRLFAEHGAIVVGLARPRVRAHRSRSGWREAPAGCRGGVVRLVPVALHRGDVQQLVPVQPGDDPGDGHAGRGRPARSRPRSNRQPSRQPERPANRKSTGCLTTPRTPGDERLGDATRPDRPRRGVRLGVRRRVEPAPGLDLDPR